MHLTRRRRQGLRHASLTVAGLCACLALHGQPAAATDRDWHAAREAAVLLARAGELEQSIARLEALLATRPGDERVRADLLVVLEWAGRHEAALELAAAMDPAQLAPYARLAWARALRAGGHAESALELLQPVIDHPEAMPDAAVLAALLLIDLDDLAEAAARLEALGARYPGDAEVAAAMSYLAGLQRQPGRALESADRALRSREDHAEASRQRVFALVRLGAAGRALELADETPMLFSAAERDALVGEDAAQALRLARALPEMQAARVEMAELALARLEQLLAVPGLAADTRRRAELDQVEALLLTGRPDQAVLAYEALVASPVVTPAHVERAAAEAYLSLRRPAQAVDRYRAALAIEPDDFDARLGLLYALAEAERFAEALDEADALVAELPPFLPAAGGGYPQANWQRLSADLAAAMLHAMANRPAEAQRRLESLAADAPASAQVRRELSVLYRWRGWPLRAQEQIELAQAREPDVLPGRLELAQVHWALEDFGAAGAAFDELGAEFADHARVLQRRDAWRDRERWFFGLEAGYGDSDGFVDTGSHDRQLRGRIAAPWHGAHWRPYALASYDNARYPEGTISYRRLGAGLEWRHLRRHAYAELDRNASSAAEAGLTLGYDWHSGDHWSFATRFESHSPAAPLRGRGAGIDGRRVETAVRWQAHESLGLRAGLSRLSLSDGNTRWSGMAELEHRLAANAHRLTHGSLAVHASRASQAGGPYFNPARDGSLGYALRHESVGWRRYERAFSQHFSLGAGAYWQEDYGTGATGLLRYEHEWRLERNWRLRYGIGVARRPYDGVHETRVDASFALQGVF